jgi:hypothetical protein
MGWHARRGIPCAVADSDDQLGSVRGGADIPGDSCLDPGAARAGRSAGRAGRCCEALPAAPSRPAAPGHSAGARSSTCHFPICRRGRGHDRRVDRSQPAGLSLGTRWLASVLRIQRGPRRRLRVSVVRAGSTRTRAAARSAERVACRVRRRTTDPDRGARLHRSPTSAAGAAGVPCRGGLLARQQGLVSAVRAMAAAVGGSGPTAVARPADLAGG